MNTNWNRVLRHAVAALMLFLSVIVIYVYFSIGGTVSEKIVGFITAYIIILIIMDGFRDVYREWFKKIKKIFYCT